MADKKVLILYASAGHGHKKAAQAVEAACRARSGVSVECVDTLKKTRFGFGANYEKLYLFLIRSLPWVWGFFYFLTDNPFVYAFVRPVRRIANHFYAPEVERLVAEGGWDTVISTHFLGTEVTSHLKKKGKASARLVTVVTDYLPHSFWLAGQNDIYCVASRRTLEEMVRRGVPAEKIRVTGIPVEPKFTAPLQQAAARQKLALNSPLFTVLLTSGGAGVGSMEAIIDSLIILEPPLQLLAVCGTNEALRARLQAKHRDRTALRLFGFVDNIHELMAASDVVVGKGGGLTVTESLTLSRPMILVGALPGQETRNVRVLTDAHAASAARTPFEIAGLIQRHRKDASFRQNMLSSIGAMRRPRAAEDITEAALSP